MASVDSTKPGSDRRTRRVTGTLIAALSRIALDVFVRNPSTSPIPVQISLTTLGTPFFVTAETVTIPGTPQTLITSLVPVSTTRRLKSVTVICRGTTKYRVKIGSALIGSGRTGPGSPESKFVWDADKDAATGTTITVIVDSKSPAQDIEVFLQAIDF